jgi:hypothetical protein
MSFFFCGDGRLSISLIISFNFVLNTASSISSPPMNIHLAFASELLKPPSVGMPGMGLSTYPDDEVIIPKLMLKCKKDPIQKP